MLKDDIESGQAVATVLAGAWRGSSAPPTLTPAALAEVAPRLLASGAGSLGWWRLRHSELKATRPARELKQAYRLHTLQAVEHEGHLREVVPLLRAAGVEAILVKGWSAARLYPETGLRPYGDLDLCVRPDQVSTAITVLNRAGQRFGFVELHEGIPDLAGRSWDEAYRRSQLVPLDGVLIHILGPEDQLRQLVLHQMRHGAHRPLWLCDIGAVIETITPTFDWGYCLSGDRGPSAWVLCFVGLACRLLEARLTDAAIARRADDLPPWLVPAVLRKWGSGGQRTEGRLARWLDPITRSYRARLRPSRSRLRAQFLGLLGGLRELPARIGRNLRKRRRPTPDRFTVD